MDELYAINLNIDRVRTEQCDRTKQMEGNSKIMWEEVPTKNTIIKLLSENLNQTTNSFYKTTETLLPKVKRMEIVNF